MNTTAETTIFSPMTKVLVDLGRRVPVPRTMFVETKLEKRTSTSDVLKMSEGKIISERHFLYLVTFPPFIKKDKCYLIPHFSKVGDKCLSYISPKEDTEEGFHVSTEKLTEDSFLWNENIILITY